MFTGIIEEVGTIQTITSSQIIIKAKKILENIIIGDSIAVNGICLSVTSFSNNSFSADIMPITIKTSSLQQLTSNDKVNLERAVMLNKPLGGHIVTGHIDGVGKIQSIKKQGNAYIYHIATSEDVMRYIIKKGSIAIDGISLTVANLNHNSFEVSIIPQTIKDTTLFNKKNGDVVNLENDIIGKYVEKLLNISTNKTSTIDKELLIKMGF